MVLKRESGLNPLDLERFMKLLEERRHEKVEAIERLRREARPEPGEDETEIRIEPARDVERSEYADFSQKEKRQIEKNQQCAFDGDGNEPHSQRGERECRGRRTEQEKQDDVEDGRRQQVEQVDGDPRPPERLVRQDGLGGRSSVAGHEDRVANEEIGRASCRERV